MTRRCSHCSNNGHNSRTCPTRGGGACSGGVRLFGVRLTDGSIIKKSASMGNLLGTHYHSSSSNTASPNPDSPLSDHVRDPANVPEGYLSDDPAHGSGSSNRRTERKKGTAQYLPPSFSELLISLVDGYIKSETMSFVFSWRLGYYICELLIFLVVVLVFYLRFRRVCFYIFNHFFMKLIFHFYYFFFFE